MNIGDLVIATIDFHLAIHESVRVVLIEEGAVMLIIDKWEGALHNTIGMEFLKDGRKLTSEGGIANWDRFIKVLND